MRHHSVFPREQLLTNGTSGLSLMDGLVMCKWIIAAENFATLVAHIFCWTAWGCCRSCRKPSTWLFMYPLSNYRDRKSSVLHHITIKQKHWLSNNCCWQSVYSMLSKCFHLSKWGANCKRTETGITPTYPSEIQCNNHCETSIIHMKLHMKYPLSRLTFENSRFIHQSVTSKTN